MNIKDLERKIVQLESTLKEVELKAARLESAQHILNILGKYENLHSASRQEECIALFAMKTPGVRATFNGNIYEGPQGIRNHYTGLLAASEKDLTGRLYAHELLTPIVQVAKDNQSAKTYFSSLGFETLVHKDGYRESLWSFCKLKFDFIMEDGEWKIYRLDMHGVFNTPYTGKGWAEEPYKIGFASSNVDPWDPRWAPDGKTEIPYKPLSTTTADCDIHNFVPLTPEPYNTWDED